MRSWVSDWIHRRLHEGSAIVTGKKPNPYRADQWQGSLLRLLSSRVTCELCLSVQLAGTPVAKRLFRV